MRNILILLLTAVFSLGVLGGICQAQDIDVYMDNSRMGFDVPPMIEEGRTLVPLRAIFEGLGAEVDWNGETRTVTARRENTSVKLQLGSKTAYRNNSPVELDVPGKIENGRTLVPLRFVSEALGASVSWDSSTRTITISSDGKTGPGGNDLTVTFLDVGQGDAILVQAPDGSNMLVDAGPKTAGQKIVDYLKKAGISSIDIFVASHPHADHIGGAQDIFDNFEVKKVYDGGYPHTSLTYENFLTTIDEKDIDYNVAHRGNSIELDGNLDIKIMHPGTTMGDANNNSVVLKVTYNKTDFILTGDAEKEAEEMVLEYHNDLDAEILKVGHHGSRTSMSQEFLNEVSPEIAIIMVGEGNSYGHPHQETLDSLSNAGAEIFRTDKAGNIIVNSNGISFSVDAQPWDYTPSSTGEKENKEEVKNEGKYVGSVKSDKYHYPDCRYAESINPENEIWFDSKEEAEAAGYQPCGVCNP